MMQYYFKVEKKFLVPPQAFKPQPKVDSAIVSFIPYSDLSQQHKITLKDDDSLKLVAKLAFQQRRKTLKNNLKEVIPTTAYAGLDIDPSLRAEMLCMTDFIKLANFVAPLIKP